jgi:Outer membrane protein beta-barrel domain
LKRIPILITFIFIISSVSGQVKKPQNLPGFDYKRLHFGFTVGLNTMDFGIRRPSSALDSSYVFADVSRITPGFQVSIVSDLRLADYFSLRFLPGITFGQRTLYFYKGAYENAPLDKTLQLESNFIDFPLLVKYKSKRVNNYAPYLIAGGTIRYDLAARKDYEEDTQVFVKLKPFDYYFDIGFGIDIYLQYFKFSPELKLSTGFRNVIVADKLDDYNRSIDRLNSYIIMLCFHFE